MTIVFPKWVTKLGATLVGIAAFVEILQTQVLALLANVGITLPPNLAIWVAVLGGVLAALGKALGDADGDGIPDGFQRRGTSNLRTLALLLTLVGIAGLAVAACGAGRPNVTPAPFAVTAQAVFVADTGYATFGCVVPSGSTCRWSATVNGAPAGSLPDALTATVPLTGVAVGDSVRVVAQVWKVRRGLQQADSVPPKVVAIWAKRTDVRPGAVDSVFVVQVVFPPVDN